jgi:hypothetical protein
MTGLPAATAAAKSPPAMPLNAYGKLFGPNTTTGPPSGAWIERNPAAVSMVARRQLPSRAAFAAWRSWPVVRGSSALRRRGSTGRPVSRCAASISASARASMASA